MGNDFVSSPGRPIRRSYEVPPARVHGNDWRALEVSEPDSFTPAYFITIVIPYFEQPSELELTLAGIERQTYPRELFEVVVVDDGSNPPLATPETSLELRVEYQEDLGFGLARARNTGARAAAGDIIVFLDCDMIPDDDWLVAHARWHHTASDALTMGFRFHVEVDGIDATAVRERPGTLAELFEGREVTHPEWIENHMARTNELSSDDDDLFRVVTGGNFGISRSFFEVVGGFDETFTQWGAEDREFAYRAYTMGSLLVPERKAQCWHQGPGATHSEEERSSLELQLAKMSQLVAHRVYRRQSAGRSFIVPEYVVTLKPANSTAETVLANTEEILASSVSDLAVWIEQRPVDHSFEWLQRQLKPDPRVFFGPPGGAIDHFPTAPFHITLDCGSSYDSGIIARLRANLGTAAAGTAVFTEGAPVTIVRSWAWHRARRLGVDISEVGETVEFTQRNKVSEEFEELAQSLITGFDNLERRIDNRFTGLEKRIDRRSKKTDNRFTGLEKKIDRRSKKTDNRFTGLEKKIDRRSKKTDNRFTGLEKKIDNRFTKLEQEIASTWLSRLGHIIRRFFSEAASVRSPSDAWQFVRWLYRSALSRITKKPQRPLGTVQAQPPEAAKAGQEQASHPPGADIAAKGPPQASYSLGADIVAKGPRAEAVFKTSQRVRNDIIGDLGHPDFPFLGGRHVDLLVIDSSQLLNDLPELPTSARVLNLGKASPMLSVPAFDPEQINPIGWIPDHIDDNISLGPPANLPGGVSAGRAVDINDPAALRQFHHLEDIAEYHDNTIVRAGTLAALAASGIVVHLADTDPGLEQHLGGELYRLMSDDQVIAADSHSREAISIAMRRAALRTHSLRSRARHSLTEGGVGGHDLPEVSILIPTRWPDRLSTAVEAVARQRYPRLELVLGLHGEGFDSRSVAAAVERLGHPVETVRISAEEPLGAVLNAAVTASSGTLLAKMDDDDSYSDEHIWDLVLAHEFSRAQLVAKASEYVYLSRLDKTVRLTDRQGERYIKTRSVSGGVVMISRHDLAYAGGWRRLPRQVDLALAEDVLRSSGRIYWTHGAGYMRIRHGGEHTWKIDDDFFLRRALAVRDGLDSAFAGLYSFVPEDADNAARRTSRSI